MKYLNLFLTLLMSWFAHVSIAQENTARVSGEMGTLKNGDTLLLKVYNYGRFNLYKGEPMEHTYTTVIKNHSFAFQIPVSQKIAYVNLGLTGTFNSSYLNQYLIEVHDNVRLSETEGKLSYSGPGSDKVKIALRCQKLWDSCLIKGSSSNYFNKRDIPALYRILDSTAVIVEQYLQDQRSLLSAQASEILQADWLAMIGSQKVFDYR